MAEIVHKFETNNGNNILKYRGHKVDLDSLKNKKLTKTDIRKLINAGIFTEKLFSEFNKTACCNCKLQDKGSPTFTKDKGCCTLCGYFNGYIDFCAKFDHPDLIKKLKEKYGFNEENGFFDIENKCCTLPRSSRSITCLAFCCDRELNQLSLRYLENNGIDRILKEKGIFV